MATRYRPISYSDFKSWMDEIGFVQVAVSNAHEYAFERVIDCKLTANQPGRFKIQIMSSVDMNTGVTREVGADAIRVLLLDTQPTKPGRKERVVLDWKVLRTMSARQNLTQRARDAWGYVRQGEHHCTCGSLMIERKGKTRPFLGCTAFPDCREIRPLLAA